jgi:hypothetical protein
MNKTINTYILIDALLIYYTKVINNCIPIMNLLDRAALFCNFKVRNYTFMYLQEKSCDISCKIINTIEGYINIRDNVLEP